MATLRLDALRAPLGQAKQNMEDVRLIRFDPATDDEARCKELDARILAITPAGLCCTDDNQCLAVLNATRNEKVVLIIWNASADNLLSTVHHYPSLFAIFIYSKKRSYVHDKLCSQYSKIAGIYTDPEVLLSQVLQSVQAMQRMTMAFSMFDQKQKSIRDLSKHSACFIWHQLLIEVLRNMPADEQSKNDMLALCEDFYASKQVELSKIVEFRLSYTKDKAILWYSDESFLYKLLNRALRTEDIDLIYSFRFFIIDLSTALDNECKKLRNSGYLTLYRGQGMSSRELEQLRTNIGALISFNGFLSTSRSIDVAVRFAHHSAAVHKDFQTCLIEIRADPSLKSLVLADIDQFSKMKGEQEVLFGLATTFKVTSIERDEILSLWRVQFATTDEGTNRTQDYIRAQKEMMKEYSPLASFGRLLWNELGQVHRAEKYFEKLLKSIPPNHEAIADIYNGIGCVYAKKGEIHLALRSYQEAYEFRKRTLKKTDPKIAGSLHNMAVIYKAQGNSERALNAYCRALDIHEKNYPGDHAYKAYTMEAIGLTYRSKSEFETALTWLRQALDMHTRLFPAEHPDVAKCLGSIGSVHEAKGELDTTLEYYYRQLEMEEKCLPLDHPRLVKHLEWIARIYSKKNDHARALALHEEKLAKQRQLLDDNHSDIALRLMKIGDLLKRQKEYYDQALKSLEKCTPADPILQMKCLDTLSTLALNHDESQLSLTHQMDILDICRRIYEPDHPDIAIRLEKIGDVYRDKVHNDELASQCYAECLAIYQTIYNPRHKKLIDIQNKLWQAQGKLAGSAAPVQGADSDDKDFSLFD